MTQALSPTPWQASTRDFSADADQREQMRQRRRIEDAQRPVERLAHRAEDGAPQREGPLAAPKLRDRAAALIAAPYDLLGEAHRHARAQHHRQRSNDRSFDGREVVERPLRGIFTGTLRDQRVRLTFLTEKAQHRRHRRKTDPAVAHAGRVQPVLVELEPRRHEVRNPLMETRHQHPPDSRSIHSSDILPAPAARSRRALLHCVGPEIITILHDSSSSRTPAGTAAGRARRQYQLPPDALPQLPIEYPPTRELGDLATPVAFELARRLRKAPRAIAQELAAALGPIDGISRVEAAAERIPEHLSRSRRLRTSASPRATATVPDAASCERPATKTIVEHTAINPNKAAHIGHLRNSALGDTLVRVQRFRGVPVEVQNYIDDTGVQVADVVVGFRELEHKGLDDIRTIADSTRFDYYCWDLYARVTQWYDEDKARLKIRAATLHDIEHGGTDASDIARFIADRIVRCHLQTMARLNVEYDLLTWEGHILRLQFWARAFEILKEQGAVYLQTEGKLAGCWVMRIEEDETAPGSGLQASGQADEAEEREKVIVRSNGTVTYVGKDIAYQFWKLGLLGRDFYYRPFSTRPDGRVLWSNDRRPGRNDSHPPFGQRRGDLQRHRCSAVVSSEASEAGAAHARIHASRPNGRPTSPTRWWRCPTPRHARWATSPPTPRTTSADSWTCQAGRARA